MAFVQPRQKPSSELLPKLPTSSRSISKPMLAARFYTTVPNYVAI